MGRSPAKAALRVEAQVVRRDSSANAAADASERAARNFLENIVVDPASVVSAYWPIRDELDPLPLLSSLQQQGCRCALPVVVKRDTPLIFREWSPGEALENGPFGTCNPGSAATEITPDVLVVPLLAFDDQGYRLGYGGGYYDRTLRILRRNSRDCLAVGFAYSGQKFENIPVSETDERLDWIVTEACARAFS